MAILGPGDGTLQNGILTNVTSIPQFIATGSKMIFEQTSAPVNWTKVTTGVNNYAMRVVTGTAAPGGTVAFSTVFSTARGVSGSVGQGAGGGTIGAAGANIDAATLSLAQIPPHGHQYNRGGPTPRGAPLGGAQVSNYPWDTVATGGAGGGGAHGHGSPAHQHPFTGAQHVHPWSGTVDLNVFYVDVIIATKN
jgi:hypothetical protein